MSATPPTPSQPAGGGRLDPRDLARAKRDAMAVRARRIRRWVAGSALTLFVVAFLIVYVQLASGHDPALTANGERRAASAKAAARKTAVEHAKAERERESSGSGSTEAQTGSSATESESGTSTESEMGTSTESESGTAGESESGTSTESESGTTGESEESGPSSLRTSQS